MYACHERGGDDDRVILSAAVWHVLPDEHTAAVTVIVPAQGFDLDMLAKHVEAHGFGGGDVVYHRLVRRRGVQPVGPVALIEQAVMEVRLVIQKQARHAVLVLFDRELAHGKVALHLILAAGDAEAVELRMLRRPRLEIRHRDARRQQIRLPAEMRVRVLISHNLRRNINSRTVEIGRYAKILDVRLRHRLKPHGLPDAALRGIPYAAAAGLLLAAAVEAAVGIVRDADGDEHTAVLYGVGDVRREWQVAADMAHDLHRVHPYRRALVDRAEVQNDALARKLLRQRDVAPVPEVLPGLQTAVHARQLAFRRERDDYLSFKLLGMPRRGGDGVLPRAVEVQPEAARKLWARVFRQRHIQINFVSPRCVHRYPPKNAGNSLVIP